MMVVPTAEPKGTMTAGPKVERMDSRTVGRREMKWVEKTGSGWAGLWGSRKAVTKEHRMAGM